MANYLALIRKADFVDLFKYGSLHINRDMIRKFSCKVEDLSYREPIFNDLTNFANGFDSTFEYLFIHYENFIGRDNDVNIVDVRGIYPLDYEAKTELLLSLDPRIKINDPLWPNAVFNLQKKKTLQNCKNGVSNIWKIYNLSESMDDLSHVITDEVLGEVIDELYDNRHPVGKLPVWVYIMRYERHAFYPNNTIGAFMDSVNAIFNYKAEQEVDSEYIESTEIMRFLQKCNADNPKMNFNEILQTLYKQTDLKILNFINYAKEISSDFDIMKTASLFFIYRNRYKEEFKYEKDWNQRKTFGVEFSISCYMLGFILGYEHTYNCLYKFLPLSIFKTKIFHEEEDIVKPIDEEKCHDFKEFYKDNKKNIPQLTCMMGDPKKKGGFKKLPIPRKVESIEEYLSLKNKGWKIMDDDKLFSK